MKPLLILTLALPLVACGTAPAEPDTITVVGGERTRASLPVPAAKPAQLATVPMPAAPPPTLTVEETARIRTDQMWSEPIPAEEL